LLNTKVKINRRSVDSSAIFAALPGGQLRPKISLFFVEIKSRDFNRKNADNFREVHKENQIPLSPGPSLKR